MLDVNDLSIQFKETTFTLKNVHFSLKANEILGIVGESGSGKSISSLAILGLLGANTTVEGEILFEGRNLCKLNEREFQKIRGRDISMIFQEPMSSLNPSLTCGYQVAEILHTHTSLSKTEIKKEVIDLFDKVKLPHPERFYQSYPHEISGGQKQRVMIAMAIACKPKLLIADEPTTALDVTVQREIIQLLKNLQREHKMSIIFISHDLPLVSEIADNIVVMYQGAIVEKGDTVSIFTNPKENYTKALLEARPSLERRLKTLPTISDFIQNKNQKELYSNEERKQFHKKIYALPPILEVIDLKKEFIAKTPFFSKPEKITAVDTVSFQIYEGETLGLVGESGCGKTTLGKTILHLEKATSGAIFYRGKDITNLSKNELKKLRREVQIIFQDPFSSLNPRKTVGNAILEPMRVHGILNSYQERKAYVLELLVKVGLTAEHFYRYPHEFSGGQRQRIGIARTIAVQPKLIVCDESVSALDVSVQAQVLNLLNQLKSEFNFTYIFISHDLSVVKYMADQLIVMHKGKIEETGDADKVYKNPKSIYTKALIEAIPKGF